MLAILLGGLTAKLLSSGFDWVLCKLFSMSRLSPVDRHFLHENERRPGIAVSVAFTNKFTFKDFTEVEMKRHKRSFPRAQSKLIRVLARIT